MRSRRIGAVLLVTLALSACGDDTSGDGTSGIAGRAMLGPTCPVEQEDSPCPDRPYGRAELRITDRATGDVVASVTTDGDGRFRVPLSPGGYVIDAEPTEVRPLPFAKPLDVTVRAGEYTEVIVAFDTGIR